MIIAITNIIVLFLNTTCVALPCFNKNDTGLIFQPGCIRYTNLYTPRRSARRTRTRKGWGKYNSWDRTIYHCFQRTLGRSSTLIFFQICITLTKWQFLMQPVMSTDRIAGKRQFKVRLVSCLCHCGSVCHIRAESRFAPSQWETALLCNDVSHWLGANLESALILYAYYLSPLYFTRYRVILDPGHNGKCVRMRHRTGAGTGCISMSPIHLGPVLVCLVDMGIIFISFKQHGNLFVKQKWFGSCLICSLDL